MGVVEWEEHLRLWLRAGLSGCEFARTLAGKADRIAVELHVEDSPPSAAQLNSALDNHAAADESVVVVLPRIVNERQLVDFLGNLTNEARWRVRDGGRSSPFGGSIVGLEWTTPAGDVSDVMGLGPLPMMPVPRRAPYVALAIWPGSRRNPFRGSQPTPAAHAKRVSFLDASHGIDEETYRAMYQRTERQVGSLMSMPPDDAALYRRAGFVLSPDGIQLLRTALARK